MENQQTDTPAAAAALNLGQWLGRQEAFGAVAGRCSAAGIECVRRIRDQKLYRGHAASWSEFCRKYLGANRSSVEAQLRIFDELGADYFHVSQLAYLTPAEFRLIAPRISAAGIEAGGETVPLVPENRGRIAALIGEVRANARKTAPPPRQDRFEAALEHCQAAASLLETLFSPPPLDRQLAMVAVLKRVHDAAARLGIMGPGAQVR